MHVKFPHYGRTTCLILIATMVMFALAAPMATAAAESASFNSPVGSWKTVDDKTGQVKAIVEIREVNGVLEGRITDLFHPPAPHPLCLKCSGALKNKPVLGMRILWGMRRQGDAWTGGHILDPETGSIYRCTISLEDEGKVLRVRGYIGLSVFGRTEQWVRVKDKR